MNLFTPFQRPKMPETFAVIGWMRMPENIFVRCDQGEATHVIGVESTIPEDRAPIGTIVAIEEATPAPVDVDIEIVRRNAQSAFSWSP